MSFTDITGIKRFKIPWFDHNFQLDWKKQFSPIALIETYAFFILIYLLFKI